MSAHLAQDRSGTTAVEFAMLAPLYLLMLMGIVAYGILFGATHSIQQIAADAVRSAVAGIDPAERRSLAGEFVARNAGRYAFIDPAKLSFEAGEAPEDAGQFVVTIAYDASDLPVWTLLEGLPMPGKTISRAATIRLGGS